MKERGRTLRPAAPFTSPTFTTRIGMPPRRMEQPADREFGRNTGYGVQRAAEVKSFLELLYVFINLSLNFSRSLHISKFLVCQSHYEILIVGLPSGRSKKENALRVFISSVRSDLGSQSDSSPLQELLAENADDGLTECEVH